MLFVHLFVTCAHVNLCFFSLPLGVRGWLRLLLVALPGRFFFPFCPRTEFHIIMHNDCLAYDYCVYEIFSLLSIFVVKLQHVVLCSI